MWALLFAVIGGFVFSVTGIASYETYIAIVKFLFTIDLFFFTVILVSIVAKSFR